MVSISFFVLLLATYCYSVPVNPQLDSPSAYNEFTTGKTIVDHDNKINMHLMSDEESTGVPNIHNERSFMLDAKYPVTTAFPSEHGDHDHDHDHMTRMLSDPLFPSSTMESSFEHDRHNVNFFPTTMEPSTLFNTRAVFMSGHNETSAESGESKHALSGDSFEATTNDDSHGFSSTKNTHSGESHEQPSSGESFGKTTGLLKNKPTGEKPVDRSDEKPVDQSGEKSGDRSGEKSGERSGEESKPLPDKRKPTMTKTEIIMPAKVTKTKYYGETWPVVEKEKSDN